MRITLTLLILSVLYAGTASAQPFAYVTNSLSDNVSVINVSTNTLVDTIDTMDFGRRPFGAAVTPDGDFVYVANSSSNKVSVIQTSENTVVDTVGVGEGPTAVAVTPDGDFVYVANDHSNNVSVIRISDNMVVATVGVGEVPAGVAVTLDGGFVYVTNVVSNSVSVIRTSDNTVIDALGVGRFPEGVAASPDGRFVYVRDGIIDDSGDTRAHVSVIRIVDNSVVATVTLQGFGRGSVAITPDTGLGEPGGEGNRSSSDSCSLAPSTAPSASLPVYLLIPVFILIARLWRRRTTQKHS